MKQPKQERQTPLTEVHGHIQPALQCQDAKPSTGRQLQPRRTCVGRAARVRATGWEGRCACQQSTAQAGWRAGWFEWPGTSTGWMPSLRGTGARPTHTNCNSQGAIVGWQGVDAVTARQRGTTHTHAHSHTRTHKCLRARSSSGKRGARRCCASGGKRVKVLG